MFCYLPYSLVCLQHFLDIEKVSTLPLVTSFSPAISLAEEKCRVPVAEGVRGGGFTYRDLAVG